MEEAKRAFGGRPLKEALSALQEVIKGQQEAGQEHEPTPTEYFALLSSTLSVGSGNERLPELLKVLIAVIPSSSVPVLRSQFKTVAQSLLNIAKVRHEDATSLNLVLTALGTFLQQQDRSDGFWDSRLPLECINALLAFIDDERNRIRKTVTDQLLALLHLHHKHHTNALRSYFNDFSLQVIRACTRNAYRKTLFVVMFLEYALVSMPEASVCNLIENCLKLQIVGIPKLTAAVYRMFDAFFQSPHYDFSPQTTLNCVKILVNNRPATADMESNTYYCTALASGLIVLHKQQRASSHSVLIKVLQCLTGVCDSEFTQVHCAVGTALKRITSVFIDAALIKAVTNTAPAAGTTTSNEEKSLLSRILACLEQLFHLKYQHAWLYILDSVRSLFDAFKGNPQTAELLFSTIDTITKLYQGIETQVINVPPSIHIALADTLGNILRACGVVNFLKAVPLMVSNDHNVDLAGMKDTSLGIESCREWIISILHSNLKLMPCALADFGMAILPVASKCSKASKVEGLTAAQVKVTRNRVLQLWSLLPEMCFYRCTDIVTSFAKLSPIMLNLFDDDNYPELIPHVVNAFTNLAKGVRERSPGAIKAPEYVTLQESAPVVIKAVLRYMELLDLGDGHFQEGLHCITAWMSIAPEKFISKIATAQLKVILTPSVNGENDSKASAAMAIVMGIIPQLPKTITDILYQTISPLLNSDNASLQKRAYCILNELLTSHPEIVYAHKSAIDLIVQVHESLLTCHVSSRNMRFRCLVSLLNSLCADAVEEDEETEGGGELRVNEQANADLKRASDLILGEILICQKDSNKKSRDAALEILKLLISRLSPMDILMQLCSALVGETSIMRSSAVTGMCMLILENRDNYDLLSVCVQLLPTVCMLLKEESADQTKAVLSFIRVMCAVLPKEVLVDQLPSVVEAFTSELGSQKSKFSSRCRGILRKLHHRVGEEVLREVVPASDIALLDYICKQQRRADRRRERRMKSSSSSLDKMLGSDSEDSSDDEDGEEVDGENEGEGMQVDRDRPDYRLAARPKAIRARDSHQLGAHIPTTLMDLLEDQPAVGPYNTVVASETSTGKRSRDGSSSRGATAASAVGSTAPALPQDEDEEYTVAVTADGKVVIKERPAAEVTLTANAAAKTAEKDAAEKKSSSNREESGNKKRKLNLKEPGAEYRSKKAGGDVWKKGMLEPHAYIPLDARLFSKKNHDQAVGHFGVVVKGGKRTQQEKVNNWKGRHKISKR